LKETNFIPHYLIDSEVNIYLKIKENPQAAKLVMEYPPLDSFNETELIWTEGLYGLEGDFYLGQLNKEKQKHGRGYYYWATLDQYYVGYWRWDKMDIRGSSCKKGIIRYLGEMKDDRFEGEGKKYFSNGDHYEGCFLNDKCHGKGVYFWSNGCSWDGEFSNGLLNGKGTYRVKQGQEVQIEYKDSKVVN